MTANPYRDLPLTQEEVGVLLTALWDMGQRDHTYTAERHRASQARAALD